MEIQVRVFKVLDALKFVSKKDGSEIIKNTFVGEETAGQYPKKIAFSVMGADKFNQMGIVVGGTYNVSFDVESREWQGKWFTEASAWKAIRIDGAQGQQQGNAQGNGASSGVKTDSTTTQAQPQHEQPTANGGDADDLPF